MRLRLSRSVPSARRGKCGAFRGRSGNVELCDVSSEIDKRHGRRGAAMSLHLRLQETEASGTTAFSHVHARQSQALLT